MNGLPRIALSLLVLSAWAGSAGAADPAGPSAAPAPSGGRSFCIDFQGGSDESDGLSPQSAWKHCPGDAAAEGKAKAAALQGGDTVRFKGGVDYRGTVVVPWSGAEGKPITYDGNSPGFGAGAAVIQGAEPVTGWKKAASAQEVDGNPNWQKLYCAELEPGRSFFSFSLYEGDAYLNCAQDPPPEIPFYHDRLNTYLRTATADQSSLTDANYFTQKEEHYYDGAYVALFVKPAVINYRRITRYEPGARRILFEPHRSQLYGGARGHQYSLLNSLKFLGRPGEYVIEEPAAKGGRPRLVLWPRKPGAAGPEGVTISARRYGFEIRRAGYVTIQGFRILQQGGDGAAGIVKSGSETVGGVVIRDNEISRVRTYPSRSAAILMGRVERGVIERNDIHENAYCAGLMLTQFNDSVARGNLLRQNGSTAIDYYNCHRSRILRNVIRDNLGMHANGITMYVGCTDILVQGNEVHNANGVTTNEGNDIVIRYNLFDGGGAHMPIGLWASPPLNRLTIENNLILNSTRGDDWSASIYVGNKLGEGWIIRNNVIDGIAGEILPDTRFGHNIYTRLGPAQKGRPLAEGEKVVEDPRKLFVDPAKGDYRPLPGGPLIDAGTDVGAKEDFAGAKVPQGKAPDIGAYEHQAAGTRE